MNILTFDIIEEMAFVSTATESANPASPISPEDIFVPKSNKADETRFIEMAPEDYDYYEMGPFERHDDMMWNMQMDIEYLEDELKWVQHEKRLPVVKGKIRYGGF